MRQRQAAEKNQRKAPSVQGHHPLSGESDTATAWEGFVAGEDVSGGVRPEILLSWHRSRDDFKVDPWQERAPSAPDDSPPRSLEDDVVAAELAGVAKSLEAEAEAIDGLVAVTDGRGRILAAWGDRQALRLADEANLAARCTWSEEMAGTNGMGTALASSGPVFVRESEHWCAGFHEWSCAGIAIRDPLTNHPLGVIDISSRRKPLSEAVLIWLRRAALGVEAGLRDRAIRSFCDLVTVFREHERVALGPLAAADNAGRLVLANKEAQRFFGTGTPDPPRELEPHLPELKGALAKAVEQARRDSRWVGEAHLHVPALGTAVSVSFRPALREQRVVGVLLSATAVGEEGELFTTEEPALASAPSHSRLVGLEAKSQRMILLSTEEIRFAEADGSDVWLDTDRGRLRAPDRGLGLLEERLRPQGFLRVHRHFLVNPRRVDEIAPSFQGCFWLVLDGPGHQLIPVSRRRIAEVRRNLGLSWSHNEASGSA